MSRALAEMGLLYRRAAPENSYRDQTPVEPAVCKMHAEKTINLTSLPPCSMAIFPPLWKRREGIPGASVVPSALGKQKGRDFS